jgi:putative transposase
MEEFNRACNTLSEMAFQQNLHRKYGIHHAGYHLIREETNLPAQHVINAIAKVTNACTREPNKFHRFKPHSSVRYDARTMGSSHDCYAVSLALCPKGRLTGQLQMSARMRKQLCAEEPGSAELVYHKGSFCLHISITIPAPGVPEPSGSLCVDLGVNRVAFTSNKKFHTAKKIRHKKAFYKRTRRSLQANGSKSAKRALKRVSGRERRFVADTNHCVSKQIVAEARANNRNSWETVNRLNTARKDWDKKLAEGLDAQQIRAESHSLDDFFDRCVTANDHAHDHTVVRYEGRARLMIYLTDLSEAVRSVHEATAANL